MPNYLNYTASDLITILIFGLLFFIFAYVSVMAVYVKSAKEIKQGQVSAYEVFIKALIIQVLATVFVWVIIGGLDFQARLSSTIEVGFSEATVSFFAIQWVEADIASIVNYYEQEGKALEALGSLVILKALWIVLTIMIVFFPIGVAASFLSSAVNKHKEGVKSGGAVGHLISDIIGSIIVIMFVFSIHLAIPYAFLSGTYGSIQAEIQQKAGTAPTVGFSYGDRARSLIINSLSMLSKEIANSADANNKTTIWDFGA